VFVSQCGDGAGEFSISLSPWLFSLIWSQFFNFFFFCSTFVCWIGAWRLYIRSYIQLVLVLVHVQFLFLCYSSFDLFHVVKAKRAKFRAEGAMRIKKGGAAAGRKATTKISKTFHLPRLYYTTVLYMRNYLSLGSFDIKQRNTTRAEA